jgi:hypothetical protein
MPTKIYTDWNRPYKEECIKQPTQNQDLFISESTDGKLFYIEKFSFRITAFFQLIFEEKFH